MRRGCRAAVGLLLLLLLLLLLAGCARSEGPLSPDVVVVTIDTLRADHLGAYGSPHPLTPHLDAFAEEAAVFENAVTAIATTFPSHSTLFTGTYPRTHEVRWNGHSLDGSWTTLAEVLSDAGWETRAAVSYRAMVNRGGLGQGFDVVSDPRGSRGR